MANQNYNSQENKHNYSEKIGKVLYEPKNTNHKVSDLYDDSKFNKLKDKINSLSVSEEFKEFLLLRAAQFVVFKFDKIADYYAYQATKEEQDIIEDLCLVLLDKDQLIEHGFADVVEDL